MENCGESIISEYRQADENKRLHMFLSYRDSRMDFMKIECGQVPDLFEKGPSGDIEPAAFSSNLLLVDKSCL